jgi:nucleotide-binding universal stress UspA family protein
VLKRILLPLDPSPYSVTATEIACTVAKLHNAEITGLVILDIPDIERSIGPVPMGALHYAEKIEIAKKVEASARIESLLDKFRKKCTDEKVPFAEAHDQGYPSNAIMHATRFYDLVVIGLRTFFDFETGDEEGTSLNKLLDKSITPIIGVPRSYNPLAIIKVLVAYDGSLPASRALQRFGQLRNPDSVDVTLLNSSNDEKMGMYLLDNAEQYLKAHGMKRISKKFTRENIRDVIEKQYYDAFDSFVVGAHAREGIFDFILGSLTKFLIDKGEKPVFIGQ